MADFADALTDACDPKNEVLAAYAKGNPTKPQRRMAIAILAGILRSLSSLPSFAKDDAANALNGKAWGIDDVDIALKVLQIISTTCNQGLRLLPAIEDSPALMTAVYAELAWMRDRSTLTFECSDCAAAERHIRRTMRAAYRTQSALLHRLSYQVEGHLFTQHPPQSESEAAAVRSAILNEKPDTELMKKVLARLKDGPATLDTLAHDLECDRSNLQRRHLSRLMEDGRVANESGVGYHLTTNPPKSH